MVTQEPSRRAALLSPRLSPRCPSQHRASSGGVLPALFDRAAMCKRPPHLFRAVETSCRNHLVRLAHSYQSRQRARYRNALLQADRWFPAPPSRRIPVDEHPSLASTGEWSHCIEVASSEGLGLDVPGATGATGVSAYRRIGRDMMQKRDVRPVRDDRNGRLLVSRARLSDYHLWSIVPFLRRRPDYGGQAGTDSSLKTLTQHFVLGYFY